MRQVDPSGRAQAPRVLVVDADPALLELLDEWLGEHGCDVTHERTGESGARERFDLVVVDVPSPRQGAANVLKRIAQHSPEAPVLALSSSFFAGIEANGAVARWLGVASVLAKPVTRHELIRAVDRLLAQVR